MQGGAESQTIIIVRRGFGPKQACSAVKAGVEYPSVSPIDSLPLHFFRVEGKPDAWIEIWVKGEGGWSKEYATFWDESSFSNADLERMATEAYREFPQAKFVILA